jgi:hypothetical protein
MIKSLFRLSLRMVTGFVQSLIKLSGLDWTEPNYSTLYRRQRYIDFSIGYQKSSGGLHLVDSTGLKFLGEGECKCKKHQPEYPQQWCCYSNKLDKCTVVRKKSIAVKN